jgi:hypothetical protein
LASAGFKCHCPSFSRRPHLSAVCKPFFFPAIAQPPHSATHTHSHLSLSHTHTADNMCDYTQREYSYGHFRWIASKWCRDYTITPTGWVGYGVSSQRSADELGPRATTVGLVQRYAYTQYGAGSALRGCGEGPCECGGWPNQGGQPPRPLKALLCRYRGAKRTGPQAGLRPTAKASGSTSGTRDFTHCTGSAGPHVFLCSTELLKARPPS